MKHSVESRFFAIIAGALLVFVAPLFLLFLVLTSERAQKESRDHAEVLVNVNANALAKPLWDLDSQSVEQVLARIAADPSVVSVHVTDLSGQLDLRQTVVADLTDSLHVVTRDVEYVHRDRLQRIGRLTVSFASPGLFTALKSIELTFISIFLFAIAAVAGAAVIGNRIMVITPLLRLTYAVEATRRFGSRYRVDWRSNDEIGNLASSFNQMQSQLEKEEEELKLAHKRATDLYNLTPAMLFSTDSEDRITAVSDYWLAETGYRRNQVVGRPFSDLVEESDRAAYLGRDRSFAEDGSREDLTCKFVCAQGMVLDVLITERQVPSEGDDASPPTLSVMTDITALKRSEERIRRQAIIDHLTGLLNRQGFEATGAARIAEADAGGQELACLLIDLDRFKWINDNLGHAAGDTVLCDFARRLDRLVGPAGSAARLGGDEFAVLMVAPDGVAAARGLAQSVMDVFDSAFEVSGTRARLSASIGIACYPAQADTAPALLQRADMAMYARKRDGKNGVMLFDSAMLDGARRKSEIEAHIHDALAQDWFEVYLQPIFALPDGRIRGFEALLRLIHPEHGPMPPGEIVQVAEETGQIVEIGNRVIDKAVAALAELARGQAPEDAYVAINVSPLQVEPGLPARLAAALASHGVAPGRVVVEITEAVLMNDNPDVRMILDELARLGCRLALDDFGTGYSSLSYLNRFPVNIVKIDQSFTQALSQEDERVRQKSRMLVEGITAMAQKMACVVIAEGVETEAQWQMLQAIGVDCGQGYVYSRPLPVREIVSMIERRAVAARAGAGFR